MNNMNKYQFFWGLIIGLLLGTGAFSIYRNGNKIIANSSENREGMHSLINPLLECYQDEETEGIKNLNISKVKLEEKVEHLKNKNNLSSISVYVRDLNNGPWIGLNEKDEFIGASLLKVPMLISVMKKFESDPGLIDKKILYQNPTTNSEQYFKSSKKIEVGQEYSVGDLVNYMIYYSDNDAAAILAGLVDMETVNNTMKSVGFGPPETGKNFLVNTKIYAGFFRVLFNASYLSKGYSDAALKVLTGTEFDKGITKPLPKNIVVAHKFGEKEADGLKQVHDCGIVYYPNHPYLICVMTKGYDYEKMASSISDISKFIYDEVVEGLN